MDVRAAVAFAAGKPLTIETVDLEGPQGRRGAGRDQGHRHLPHRLLTRSRAPTPRACSRRSSATRARASCVEVGPGVTTLEEGRPRHPALHARMPAVQVLPVAQDQPLPADPRHAGQGPDARRHQPLLARRQAAAATTWARRPSPTTPSCRRSRWPRSARTRRSTRSATSAAASPPASARCIFTAKVEAGANVVVFGLGGIGLNVIQGARMVGADKIVGVDLNPAREAMAEKFGMTHFVNPKEVDGDLVDATRPPHRRRRRLQLRVHRQRATSCARRWSAATRAGAQSIIIGVAGAGAGDLDAAVPARHRPACGRARPSAARAAAPTCRGSSTGTWTARSTSTT